MATNKTIALITGANQGIGLATATILAKQHGYHVIIGSRTHANGLKVANDLKSAGFSADAIQLDLTSDTSIAAATTYLTTTYGHLDVLINNAAIFLDGNFSANLPTRELYAQTFSTNVTGTACVTESLLPLLRASAQRPRLIFMTSRMGSLAVSLDPNTHFYNLDCRAYDASKAAVNILMVNYARILGGGAFVNAVCPGLVKTRLVGFSEMGASAEVGAERVVELATLTGRACEVSGTLTDRDGTVPW